MKKIAVVGSGTMGNGIAHLFAQHNYQVNLIDISKEALEKGLTTISKNLDRQVTKGVLTNEEKNSTLSRIQTFTSIESGVQEVGLVIEAATENSDLKLSIFKELDRFASPSTLLASNTSSISITKIAAATNRPDKVIGMHFMNPVPVMKLVEIIRGYSTSDEVTTTIFDIALTLGKSPVEVNDYPGFVANRILMPMINEAIYTLYEGVAGNLVAFACKISFQKGFDGFVVFTAKTKLIKHYEENIGAYHFKNQLMIIQTESAKKLVNKYFKS